MGAREIAQWVRAHALQTLGPEFDCPASMLKNKTNKQNQPWLHVPVIPALGSGYRWFLRAC